MNASLCLNWNSDYWFLLVVVLPMEWAKLVITLAFLLLKQMGHPPLMQVKSNFEILYVSSSPFDTVLAWEPFNLSSYQELWIQCGNNLLLFQNVSNFTKDRLMNCLPKVTDMLWQSDPSAVRLPKPQKFTE